MAILKANKFWCSAGLLMLFALAALGWLVFAADTRGLAAMKQTVRARFPQVHQLPTGDLAAWLQDSGRTPPWLLDVRRLEEFAVSHLPGAVPVDPEATAQEVLRSLPANRPVVVYCSVGYRSSALAARLIQAGFTNVFNLEGSIFAWANEQRPLECDGRPVKQVHPYNAAASRMLRKDYRAKVPPVN